MGVLLPGNLEPGLLARKLGRTYTETLDETRDRVLVGLTNVTFRAGPLGRPPYRLTAFLERRAEARRRRADLAPYGYQPEGVPIIFPAR